MNKQYSQLKFKQINVVTNFPQISTIRSYRMCLVHRDIESLAQVD